MIAGVAHEEGCKKQGCLDSSLPISLGDMWRGSLHLPLTRGYFFPKLHGLRSGWAGRCAVGMLPPSMYILQLPLTGCYCRLQGCYCQEMGFPELIKGPLSFLQDQPPFSSVPNNTERKGPWNTSRWLETVLPSILGFCTCLAD